MFIFFLCFCLEADENLRDFSGRKPGQYKINKTQIGIKDSHSEYNVEKIKRIGLLSKRSSFLRKAHIKPNYSIKLSSFSGSYDVSEC